MSCICKKRCVFVCPDDSVSGFRGETPISDDGDFIMRKFIFFIALFSISIFGFACGAGNKTEGGGKTVKTGTVNNLTVTLATSDGVIRTGANNFTLTISDASGKPVDVGAAAVNFFMPSMGSMAAMNDAATLTTSGTPGVFNGKVNLQMAGEWQVQITFEGAAGKGKTSFPVTAQ
jgi:hypothetical protein